MDFGEDETVTVTGYEYLCANGEGFVQCYDANGSKLFVAESVSETTTLLTVDGETFVTSDGATFITAD